MKLIDILVKELPKRGGFPVGDGFITCHVESGKIFAHGMLLFITEENVTSKGDSVNRQQYEAALAASKRPEWSGEGRPLVGTICQARKLYKNEKNPVWVRVEVLYSSEFTVVMRELEEGAMGEEVHHPATLEFRKMNKEDIRREEAVYKLQKAYMRAPEPYEVGQVIWEHIAEGKIPGISLE